VGAVYSHIHNNEWEDAMLDRRFFIRLAATLPGAALLTGAASSANAATDKQRVAYHVSDKEKVAFTIGNIKNHIAGMGGPDNVEIVLVVHGPALREFHVADGNQSVLETMKGLMSEGVRFNACGNTMRAMKLENADLPEGMVRVDQGGVVRLAQLQQEGFLYLRP
jgi:hypothetical protein